MAERNADIADQPFSWLFAGWRGWAIALGCMLAAALCASQLVTVAGRTGLLGNLQVGHLGFGDHPSIDAPAWLAIDRVDRGGPAEHAGIRPGDLVRYDNAMMISAAPPPGTVVGLTIAHRAQGPSTPRLPRAAMVDTARHVWLRYAAVPGPRMAATWLALWLSVIGGGAFATVLGVVVLWRGWGNPAALALGLGLMGYLARSDVPWWMIQSALLPLLLAGIVVLNCSSVGLLVLPVLLYDRTVATVRPRDWIVITAVAALAVLDLGFVIIDTWHPLALPHFVGTASAALLAIAPGVSVYWTWRGRRDGSGLARNRFTVLLFADALVVSAALLSLLDSAGLDMLHGAAQFALESASTLISSIIFPLVMAYALLRHRVIDLGFVINRTLVFGTVSAILLAAFGLIEWGVEHLLPESWVRASAWIDAGAAVAVYLGFHRIHGAVETRIEHMVFQSWQANAAILRRFVESAPHFEDERALARSFADELARFSGEGRIALYRRRERTLDAILERSAGSWDAAPRTLPVDDPAFALMRAERAAIDLTDTLTDLPGVLALPMLDHGALAGVVLMDLKGDGALYRPDEIALLGWAAHEVALALAALHAGLIEAENRLLKAQLARLGSLIGQRLETNGA